MGHSLKRAPATTLVYIRGRTDEEIRRNIDTTLRHAHDHAGESWLNQPAISQTISNVADHVVESDPSDSANWEEQSLNEPLGQIWICNDRDGSRAGLHRAIKWLVDQDHVMTLVVPDVDHLVDRDNGTAHLERLLANGVDVHLSESGVTIRRATTVDGKTRRVVRTLSESISGTVQTGDSYAHKGGRPPLGFVAEDGQLVPDTDGDPPFSRVCNVLQQVKDGHVSKRQAAQELDCVRGTVLNCLDRPEMYGLDE